MNEYIPTAVYREFLDLLTRAIRLPESAQLVLEGQTQPQEFTMLHRIELADLNSEGPIEPKLHLTSWAVRPAEGSAIADTDVEQIDPEFDWARRGYFWIGAASRIFLDSEKGNNADKRWGGFAWCGNNERQLTFPTFAVLKDGPVFETTFRISQLRRYSPAAKTKVPAVFVGTVDAMAGTFTPAPPAYLAPGLELSSEGSMQLGGSTLSLERGEATATVSQGAQPKSGLVEKAMSAVTRVIAPLGTTQQQT